MRIKEILIIRFKITYSNKKWIRRAHIFIGCHDFGKFLRKMPVPSLQFESCFSISSVICISSTFEFIFLDGAFFIFTVQYSCSIFENFLIYVCYSCVFFYRNTYTFSQMVPLHQNGSKADFSNTLSINRFLIHLWSTFSLHFY